MYNTYNMQIYKYVNMEISQYVHTFNIAKYVYNIIKYIVKKYIMIYDIYNINTQ